jgi:integrase
VADAKKLYMSKLSVKRPDLIDELLRELPDSLSISKVDIVNKLQKKAAKAPVMANRMLTRWKDFYEFCTQQGWIETNPLAGVLRKFVGGKEEAKDRVLTDEEIYSLKHPVLLYMLLTGLRSTEAIYSLTYSTTKNIPTKTPGYKHTLPRSHLIQYALKQKIDLPASHLTLSNYLRRKIVGYTPHDLRRTFATRVASLGVEPYVIEKLLGHKMPGVMAVYNHAEYWPERVAAQRLWDKALIALWRSKDAPA